MELSPQERELVELRTKLEEAQAIPGAEENTNVQERIQDLRSRIRDAEEFLGKLLQEEAA